MIERKGHEVFFQAVAMFSGSTNWLAWIEGDGPFLEKYKREALRLGIADRCRFLGFCQMSLHSWLIRNSDIVVVPSLHDPWGIVVDEGMQLGKAVVTTYETGAGVDRITSGINGVLLTAGNVEELSINLRMLITDEKKRSNLGNAAKVTASSYRPSSNANLIYRLLLSER
jgi:glycosyltransferase involved in cell wall biosynthesis